MMALRRFLGRAGERANHLHALAGGAVGDRADLGIADGASEVEVIVSRCRARLDGQAHVCKTIIDLSAESRGTGDVNCLVGFSAVPSRSPMRIPESADCFIDFHIRVIVFVGRIKATSSVVSSFSS